MPAGSANEGGATRAPGAVNPYPSSFSRTATCPTVFRDAPASGGWIPPTPNVSVTLAHVDATTLAAVAPRAAALLDEVTVILVRRVAVSGPGDPSTAPVRLRYLTNAPGRHLVAAETWSASKVFAAMSAAGALRLGAVGSAPPGCAAPGLQSTANASGEVVPFGDLVTVITTYDVSVNGTLTSNGLAGWFNSVGGRSHARDLVQKTLQRPEESLGANYGAPMPDGLSYTFSDGGDGQKCSVTPDQRTGYSNTLSTFVSAELLRRVVLAREDPSSAIPGTEWADSEDALYGAAQSRLFPGTKWGGMSAALPASVTTALNLTAIDRTASGRWRVFTKEGAGFSTSRNRGEVTLNTYLCLPHIDQVTGQPIAGAGAEAIVSARVSILNDTHVAAAGERMVEGAGDLVKAIAAGLLH